MDTLIAVPSQNPGGLEAAVGEHFGHCELYTLVQIQEGTIKQVEVIPNVPHQQGGCMAPVNHLAGHGVKKLIAGGMGLRPLMGFGQVGIDVYHGGNAANVGEAVAALLKNQLPQFTQRQTCGGGDHNCGQH